LTVRANAVAAGGMAADTDANHTLNTDQPGGFQTRL